LKTAFVYMDRDLECDYGWSHPLKIRRLKLTFDLCKSFKLLDLHQTSLVEGAPQIPEALAPDLAPARTLRDPALVSERQENCRQRMNDVLDCLEKNLLPIHERSM
jgi:hypothetical protein